LRQTVHASFASQQPGCCPSYPATPITMPMTMTMTITKQITKQITAPTTGL
jgi:hypothetical protein